LSDNSILINAYEFTYEDTSVELGKTYYYYVLTEVDGNNYFSEADAGYARQDLNFVINSSHGSPSPSTGTYTYTAATNVPSGSVSSPADQTSSVRYICTGYSGTGNAPSGNTTSYPEFTIEQESGITWNWKPQYIVTVSAGSNGIVTSDPSGWHDGGDSITVTAQPDSGFDVDRWLVNGTKVQDGGTSLTRNNLSGAQNISVLFTNTEVNFSITSEHGNPSPEVGSNSYNVNDSVPSGSVTSPADDNGSQRFICTGFIGTGDAPTGTSTSYSSFQITQDSSITWQWKTQYMVSMQMSSGGVIVGNPSGWHDENCSITASVQPNSGYEVEKWFINGTAYQNGGNDFSFDSLEEPTNIYVQFMQADTVLGDFTGEGDVNMLDFAVLASQWMNAPGTPSADISVPADGFVDALDLVVLAENWLIGLN
jgi:hypothetical protein